MAWNGWRSKAALVTVGLMALLGCGGKEQPKAGTVLDEARRADRAAASLPRGGRGLLPRHGRRRRRSPPTRSRAATRGSSGPAATTASGTCCLKTSFGALDFLKTLSSHPELEVQPRQPLELPRPGQRAVLREGDRPRPEALRAVARQRAAPTVRPIRSRTSRSIPGVADRRARQEPAGRLLLRLRRRGIVGLRLFPEPGLRRGGREEVGRGALLHRSELLQRQEPGQALSRRHVLRLLPRRAEPDQAAGRSREPEVGEPQLQRRRAVLLGRSHLRLATPTRRASSSSCSTPRGPGALDTSLVSTDNINNPRTMNAVYSLGAADGARASAGARRRSPAASLNNKQFNDYVTPTARCTQFFETPDTVWTPRVLKDGSDSVGALGALNRVYLNIGLFSEEWLLHFNAARRRQADHRRSRSPSRRRTRPTGRRPRQQTPDMALLLPARRPARTT